MKKVFPFLVAVLLAASVFLPQQAGAQSPEKISYQAVIRNSSNQLITNKQVGMKISILKNSATGTVVYAETQQPSTNSNGLISIQIGDGTVVSGSFPGIDWSDGTYFIKTETDPTGDTNYTITGTSQLLSVPYAIYAKKAGSVDITGNELVFDEWDKNSNNDVNITDNQIIHGEKTFKVNIKANGIALPYTFGPDTNYVGSEGAFIGFGHYGESEDFIGYKANRFYFKDSPGGADVTDPDVIVGGKIGIGVEAPAEKLEVDGNVDMHNNTIKNIANPVNAQDAATKAYVDAKPGVPSGTQTGEVLYWDGTEWVNVPPGSTGQVLTFINGVPTWSGTVAGINDVFNPTTGEVWMDRNLGASQVATSSTDADAYGDLYQWGRAADGHEFRTSSTTSTNATTAVPNDGNSWDGLFITEGSSPYDWLTPQDDNLWQGLSGTNNPCPSGYRLPTEAEWEAERASWSSNNSAGAFASPLKLPMAGSRGLSSGSLGSVGSFGFYWSRTVAGTLSRSLYFYSSNAHMDSYYRAGGLSVRCLKDN